MHWKFNIKLVNNRYVIVNQRDKKQFIIKEVSLEAMRKNLDAPGKQKTVVAKIGNNSNPKNNENEDVRQIALREKLGVFISEQKTAITEVSNHKKIEDIQRNNQPKREGLLNWFLKIFRGN